MPNAALATETRWEDYAPWEIAEHLMATHHPYTWSELARLQTLLDATVAAHGRQRPELHEVAELYASLRAELEPHLLKEERVLFPWLEQLRLADAEGTAPPRPPFGSAASPIRVLRADHDATLEILHRLDEATDGYLVLPDMGPGWRALQIGLRALDRDLREHIRLESGVLFPMLADRESQIFGR